MSRAIHVAYEWAYARIQRHKVVFTVTIASMAKRRAPSGVAT